MKNKLKELKKTSYWYKVLMSEVKKGKMTKKEANAHFRTFADRQGSCIKQGHINNPKSRPET